MQYQIKRGNSVVETVKPTGKQNKAIMGANEVPMSFSLPYYRDFFINDYCDVFGERYILSQLSEPTISSDQPKYNYNLGFKSIIIQLANAIYKHVDANGNYTISEFSLMGNAQVFLDLLIYNANLTQSGWVAGIVDETDYKLLDFSNQSCLQVLATICDAFKGLEYWAEGQTIHLTKRGVIENLKFQYGKGNGLYDISRKNVDDKQIFTRLYAYGSNKNLPADYKGYSDRLKLPGTTAYIESNVYVDNDPTKPLLYGVIEKSQNFDDIYPRRIGLVTELGDDDITFFDSGIDFNINSQKLETVKPKVVFDTGDLAGFPFEIETFDNATKKIKINYYKDDKDYILPNENFKPAVGDQYKIVDIKMPQSYIDAAEQELLDTATQLLNDNSKPIVVYEVNTDLKYLYDNGITLYLGNSIRIFDPEMGVNDDIRIVGLTRDLQNPYLYTIQLSDSIGIASYVRQTVQAENQQKKVERLVKSNNTTYNAALQAKATAEGVKLITDYWGVTIDPDHGIVASGTLLVGTGSTNNAGVTGVTDSGLNSVRFWAGAEYDDRYMAPFRVLDNGNVVMTQADITGNIKAITGDIGQFHLLNGILALNVNHAGNYNTILLGDNIISATSPNLKGVARFEISEANNQPAGTGINFALILNAQNGDKNYAISVINGDIDLGPGKVISAGNTGISGAFNYNADGNRYKFTFTNGILTNQFIDP